jgi:hypothetical protein
MATVRERLGSTDPVKCDYYVVVTSAEHQLRSLCAQSEASPLN